MSLAPVTPMSTTSTIESKQSSSSSSTPSSSSGNVITKGLRLAKLYEVSKDIFNVFQAHSNYDAPFIGLHEKDFKEFFGTNSQNDLLAFQDCVFKPFVMQGIEVGYAVVSNENYYNLNNKVRDSNNLAVAVPKKNLAFKKVIIEIDSNKPVFVEDKKKLKQDILSIFKDKTVLFNKKYSFKWLDCRLTAQFTSFDSAHFGMITESTKLVLRKIKESKVDIVVEEKVVSNNDAKFIFHLERKADYSADILEDYCYKKLKELIPLNSVIVPNKIFSFFYDAAKCNFIFKSISIPNGAPTEDEFKSKLLAYRFNGNFEIEPPNYSDKLKFVKELTDKNQIHNQTNTVTKKEPPKNVGMTFKSYLKEKGMCGLPEDLNYVITPIIAYYGPLQEFAIQCGITPQKGLILYGPPGTGKTSVGGHLAAYLGCPEENIQKVSTPSLLDKWNGNTERNLRALFEKARNEYKIRGKDSNLHVLILDELEGLFGERKKAEKSWEKSHVNQFLTLLDGYENTPNILVVGITNHLKDLDEGLLREGRFGCQIHIGLPNKAERKEIYEEYLKVLRNNGRLSKDFDLEKLNDLSDDFSGADIKGVVSTASQKAFTRVANLVIENKIPLLEALSHPLNMITNDDFIDAAINLTETKKIKKIS